MAKKIKTITSVWVVGQQVCGHIFTSERVFGRYEIREMKQGATTRKA